MMTWDVQNVIVKRIREHAGFPFIQADQGGEIPDGPHAVFKFTVPYNKGIGRPTITTDEDAEGFKRMQSETYNITLSVTAVTDWKDPDGALALAQSIRDWFDFHGYETLDDNGIVVANLTDIGNRDTINDEEARRGFDAILRVSRELVQAANWIEKADVSQLQGG